MIGLFRDTWVLGLGQCECRSAARGGEYGCVRLLAWWRGEMPQWQCTADRLGRLGLVRGATRWCALHYGLTSSRDTSSPDNPSIQGMMTCMR